MAVFEQHLCVDWLIYALGFILSQLCSEIISLNTTVTRMHSKTQQQETVPTQALK